MTSLRRVNFFDKKTVTVPQQTSEILQTITCACAGGSDGSIWFGTGGGVVGRLDVSFSITCTIAACPSEILQVKSAKQAVLALGQLSDGACRLCAYHLYRTGNDNNPLLLGSVRIPFELNAVCFDVMPDFSFIAVGCANGNTLIYSGSTFGRTGIKPKILAPLSDSPSAITNVAFTNSGSLFIVSESDVTCVSVSGTSGDVVVEVLSSDTSHGSSRPLLAIFSSFSASLLVGKNETIFGFVADQGNVSALPIIDESNEIERIDSWKQYIGVVSSDSQKTKQLSICYTNPRFMAHSSPLTDDPLAVVLGAFDGHCVVVFGRRQNISLLREKPLSDQIALLQDKSLFEWALEIARDESPDVIADIFRAYAESFFTKGEYEKAASIFMRAVDEGVVIETSFIVSKFLLDKSFRNLNAIQQVANYLRKLHESVAKNPNAPAVNKQHTVLMILCFDALGDSQSTREVCDLVPSPNLIDMLSEMPNMFDIVSSSRLLEIVNGSLVDAKRLIELLIDFQRNDDFMNLLKNPEIDSTRIANIIKESRVVKQVVSQLLIDGQESVAHSFKHEPATLIHTEYCRTRTVSPLVASCMNEPESLTKEVLLVILEILLRTKTSSCREIIKILISRNLATEAMSLCKLFGAPANVIMQLAAASNSPFEALAYPAINLSEVTSSIPTNQDLTLDSIAIQKKLGQKSEWGSVRSIGTTPLAVLLDTVDEGSNFVTIKDRIFDEFAVLEKSITESEQRARNDSVECDRMKTEIGTIRKRPIVHQFGRPCALCKSPITDMPAVFYKCMHGYHLHCASPDQNGNVKIDCTVCASESHHHLSILHQRKDSVKNADDLFKCMAGSSGQRFEDAMAYLGHGLFT